MALLVMFWHEVVGNNAIMLYSNKMLEDMSSDDAILTPREGTYLVGVINFFSSAASVWTAKTFTRRTLFIGGHIGMGIFHILVGLCAYYTYPTLALMSMLGFIFFF